MFVGKKMNITETSNVFGEAANFFVLFLVIFAGLILTTLLPVLILPIKYHFSVSKLPSLTRVREVINMSAIRNPEEKYLFDDTQIMGNIYWAILSVENSYLLVYQKSWIQELYMRTCRRWNGWNNFYDTLVEEAQQTQQTLRPV